MFVVRLCCSFVGFVFLRFVGVGGVGGEGCEQEEGDGVKRGDGFDFGGRTCGVWESRWSFCRCAHFWSFFM